MEIANNNQIIDYRLAKAKVIQNFSGKNLEIKYFLRTQEEIDLFFQNKPKNIQEIKDIRNDMKFDRIWCRFDFGTQDVSESIQRQLIDFQIGIFDEITAQMVKDDVAVFERVYDYARKTEKPISTLVDLALHVTILGALMSILSQKKPSTTRWKHRKITTYIRKYRFVSENMQELGLEYYLTAMNKRCSIKNFEDVATSIIAQGFFGFKGCCLDYKVPKIRKGRRFAPHMDVFNDGSYLWDKQINKGNFRDVRTDNFVKLDKAKTSQSEIRKRKKVKDLFDKLKKA